MAKSFANKRFSAMIVSGSERTYVDAKEVLREKT